MATYTARNAGEMVTELDLVRKEVTEHSHMPKTLLERIEILYSGS